MILPVALPSSDSNQPLGSRRWRSAVKNTNAPRSLSSTVLQKENAQLVRQMAERDLGFGY